MVIIDTSCWVPLVSYNLKQKTQKLVIGQYVREHHLTNYEVHMILGLRKVKGKVSEMSVQERHRSGSYFSTIHFSGKTDSVTEISSCPRKR